MSDTNVAIIVPVYNAATTLPRCIDSLLLQTYSDFQLILVDDGSTDTSGIICDEYAGADSRVKVIHKRNGGVSSARNAGLDEVKGRYVCFADADDYVEGIWLETLMSLSDISNNYVPVCQVIQHKNEDKCLLYDFTSENYALKNLYCREGWGYSYNKLFLIDRIRKLNIRFDESLKVYEDELFVAAYCAGLRSFAFSEKPLYHYVVPACFDEKYSDVDFMSKLFYQYAEMKKVNPEASNFVVDRLVMSVLNLYRKTADESVVNSLCDLVGKSICHVCGIKKIPLKLLSIIPNSKAWLLALKMYAKLNFV